MNYILKHSDNALVTIIKIFANALPVFFSVSSFDCHYLCVMSLGTVVLFFKHKAGRFFKKKQQPPIIQVLYNLLLTTPSRPCLQILLLTQPVISLCQK